MTITIEILEKIEVDLGTVVLCPGETYNFDGEELSQSGTYDVEDTAASGCDSITTVTIEAVTLEEVNLTSQGEYF